MPVIISLHTTRFLSEPAIKKLKDVQSVSKTLPVDLKAHQVLAKGIYVKTIKKKINYLLLFLWSEVILYVKSLPDLLRSFPYLEILLHSASFRKANLSAIVSVIPVASTKPPT